MSMVEIGHGQWDTVDENVKDQFNRFYNKFYNKTYIVENNIKQLLQHLFEHASNIARHNMAYRIGVGDVNLNRVERHQIPLTVLHGIDLYDFEMNTMHTENDIYTDNCFNRTILLENNLFVLHVYRETGVVRVKTTGEFDRYAHRYNMGMMLDGGVFRSSPVMFEDIYDKYLYYMVQGDVRSQVKLIVNKIRELSRKHWYRQAMHFINAQKTRNSGHAREIISDNRYNEGTGDYIVNHHRVYSDRWSDRHTPRSMGTYRMPGMSEQFRAVADNRVELVERLVLGEPPLYYSDRKFRKFKDGSPFMFTNVETHTSSSGTTSTDSRLSYTWSM